MREKLQDIRHNPAGIITGLGKRRVLNWMSDRMFLKLLYRVGLGKKLDLNDPKTFNEKIQWLKLHDRKKIYCDMVDKYEVRKFVADRIGQQYLIPLLGGPWNSFDEIDFDALPDQFVLKCTHDSGGVYICKDKSRLDKDACRKKLEKHMGINFYWAGREWPYKDVKPRIIAEKYMEDPLTNELRDYKFFTFHGDPKALFVASDRQTPGEETKFDFFDMDYQHIPIKNGHPNAVTPPACPQGFEEMKRLAAILAEGTVHLRVDFYEINGRIYFGELTFSHFSGAVKFEPEEWDLQFGQWMDLTQITEN